MYVRRLCLRQNQTRATESIPEIRHASKAAASPRLRVPSSATKLSPQHRSPAQQWPVHLFEDAHRNGLIQIEPEKVVAFLADFVKHEREEPSLAVSHTLLKRHNVKPRTLSWLGWILQSYAHQDASLKPISLRLQRKAASLKDENASMILVDSALRAGKPNHSDLRDPVQNLIALSASGHVFAQERLAALYEQRGERERALTLSMEAMRAKIERPEPALPVLDPKFSAWQTVFKICQQTGDPNGALEALEVGAHDADDPEAYYHLSISSNPMEPQQRLEYQIKAAASGVGPAAYLVGQWYYEQATGRSLNAELVEFKVGEAAHLRKDGRKLDTNYLKIACEWLRIALESWRRDARCDPEKVGKACIIALLQLGETRQCLTLLREFSDMRWAKQLRAALADDAGSLTVDDFDKRVN